MQDKLEQYRYYHYLYITIHDNINSIILDYRNNQRIKK